MDCIIRVIKGADAGLTHRLQPGPTVIGRGTNAAVRLTSLDVSWEHAVITREGDDYRLENLSASGTYVGDAKVIGSLKLRPRDVIKLSPDTVLRLETPDGDSGVWMRWLLVGLVVIGLLVLGALVFMGAGSGSAQDNWDAAFSKIDAWAQGEVKARRLPPATVQLLRDGWRLEQIKDFEKSKDVWMRLGVLLDNVKIRTSKDASASLPELAAERRNALQWLLTPPKKPGSDPTDEDLAAALVQFAQRRLSWSVKQLKPSGFAP